MTHQEFREMMSRTFGRRVTKYKARMEFQSRIQLKGESVDEFVAVLRGMIQDCQFPDQYKEDALATQLIVGAADARTKLELVARADVTLQIAIAALQAAETANQDVAGFQSAGPGPQPQMGSEPQVQMVQGGQKPQGRKGLMHP